MSMILKIVLYIVLLAPIAAVVIALILAVRSAGRKRWLAWGNFALMALPLIMGAAGGILLAEKGLAWRSSVKMSLGLIFTSGVLGLFIRLGIFLAYRAENWQTVPGTLAACAIAFVGVVLCIGVAWYGLLFTAMWAGSDREVTVKGKLIVEDQDWMDRYYYDCHGPLVRGVELLEGSAGLTRSRTQGQQASR